MGDISAAGKLELVKQVRESYKKNRYDMADRERVLYGRAYKPSYDYYDHYDNNDVKTGLLYEENGNIWNVEGDEDNKKTALVSRGLFCIRLAAAIAVFVLFVAMDLKEINVSGICAEDIYDAISWDYTAQLDNWISGLQK